MTVYASKRRRRRQSFPKGATALLLFCLACAAPGVSDIEQDYARLSGKLIADPRLENSDTRLFIYLRVEDKIFVCLAANKEEQRILVATKTLLTQWPYARVELFVTPMDGAYEEILDGIDYYVHAVRVWHPIAQRHRTILTGWQKRMDMGTWRQILQRLLEKGVDKAL